MPQRAITETHEQSKSKGKHPWFRPSAPDSDASSSESDDESETDSSDGNWTSDNSGSLDAAGQYESSSEDTSNDDDSLGSTVPVTEEELSGLFLPAGELITNIIP